MKFQFRLSEQRDGDIIYWLNHTEDKSEAIRSAIRAAIEKEEAVSKALEEMSRINDPDPLDQAMKDIKICREDIYRDQIHSVADVKRFIGWLYPGEKKQLLDIAWNELYEAEKVKLSSIYGEEHENESDH